MIRLTKDSETFTGVKFVIAALDKNKDAFPHKKNLYVKDGVMTGTDGKRLHQFNENELFPDARPWERSTFENGYYEVVKNNKSEVIIEKIDLDYDYPDYEDAGIFWELQEAKKIIQPAENPDTFYSSIVRVMDETVSVKHVYINDCLCLDEFTAWIAENSAEKPLILTNGSKRAAIMPYRIQ